MRLVRLAAVTACVAACLAMAGGLYAGAADAAQLIGRDGTGVQLAVNAQGVALVTFVSAGVVNHVFARGALNASPPSESRPQVAFQIDYSGGWGFYKNKSAWKTFADSCRPYRGPALFDVVAACTASDGSSWAVQAVPVPLPDLGFQPWSDDQKATWIELSHWNGPLPVLSIDQGWNWLHGWNQIYGTFAYAGNPVYGFTSTRYGVPTDSYSYPDPAVSG